MLPPIIIWPTLSIAPRGAFLKNAFGYFGVVCTRATPLNFPRVAIFLMENWPSVLNELATDAPDRLEDDLMNRSLVPNSRNPA